MAFKKNNEQNVTQNIGTNTGAVQATSAGRNVHVTQQTNLALASEDITPPQAVEILEKIEGLIRANFPSEVSEAVEEAIDYTSMAKKEAQKKEPRKSLIVANLEGTTSLLQKLNQTTEETKELIVKLKPLFVKLTSWLGVAVNHFFG